MVLLSLTTLQLTAFPALRGTDEKNLASKDDPWALIDQGAAEGELYQRVNTYSVIVVDGNVTEGLESSFSD
jgi:hypothetical protein